MPRQPFHLVEYSPWPLTAAIGALLMTSGLTLWFHSSKTIPLILGMLIIIFTMFLWWRDVTRESLFLGCHTSLVMTSMKLGMVLFITSEVLFFFAFFWAFFQSSLAPCTELGCTWPPKGIIPLNPFSIPLLNTSILLGSGISVTWAHMALINKNNKELISALMITVSLGLYFTALQMMEYYETSFTIADSVYASAFFVATGFHGLHVIIGSIFLLVALMRSISIHYSSNHHIGFETAAWYWHFVDVVWIMLYLSIYWWGS